MKANLAFGAFFFIVVFTIPLIALSYNGQDIILTPAEQPAAAVHSPNIAPPNPPQQIPAVIPPTYEEISPEPYVIPATAIPREYSLHGVTSFLILDISTGLIEEVSVRDFVRGALAMEMPMSFHDEALRAQAVAAHTWALTNHLRQQRSPDPALRGADFAADPWNREVYMTEEKTRQFWGPFFEDHWQRASDITDSVLHYIIEFEGEPIMAAFHAMSAGKTEYAGNVWVGTSAYLLPVYSAGCMLAGNFEVDVIFTAEQVEDALREQIANITLSSEPENWFLETKRSSSGYITEAEIGGVRLHGSDIRTMFGLRSHNINISYHMGEFIFSTRGHGHGVGLPQYGAEFLAGQGYTFEEILKHYYTGVEIRQVRVIDN